MAPAWGGIWQRVKPCPWQRPPSRSVLPGQHLPWDPCPVSSPGLAVRMGRPTPLLEPWVPAAVSGSPARSVGFAQARRHCERLGGCLGAGRKPGGYGAGGERGQCPLGNFMDAQSKPCRLRSSRQLKTIHGGSCPAYGWCIHPDKSLPRLGHGTGAAGSPGWVPGDVSSSFFPSLRCCCLLFPVLLLPRGMCICFPAAPSPPPSWSSGDAAVPCRGRDIPGGRGACAGYVQASKQASPQIPAELQSSSALVWVKEN